MKKEQKAIKILPYIIVVAIAIALVVAVIYFSNDKEKDKKNTTKVIQNVTKTKENVTDSTETEEETYENPLNIKLTRLKVNDYEDVHDLVKRYFDAVIDADVDTLKEILYSNDDIDEEQIDLDREYIERYDNLTCYTIDGLYDGTYITYVYYEYKFKDIDELAPGLIRLYIKTKDDGDLYIYNKGITVDTDETNVTDEESAYIEEINDTSDAKALMDLVDEALITARENDEKLDQFVKDIDELQTADEADTEVMTTASTDTDESEEESTEESTEEATTEETTAEVTTEATTEATTAETTTETTTEVTTEATTAA